MSGSHRSDPRFEFTNEKLRSDDVRTLSQYIDDKEYDLELADQFESNYIVIDEFEYTALVDTRSRTVKAVFNLEEGYDEFESSLERLEPVDLRDDGGDNYPVSADSTSITGDERDGDGAWITSDVGVDIKDLQ